MTQVLEYGDTNGDTFRVNRPGPWLFEVSGIPSGATVKLQFKGKGNNWYDYDATGSTAATWTSDGVGAIYMNRGRHYRMNASAVGARADIQSMTGEPIMGPEVTFV